MPTEHRWLAVDANYGYDRNANKSDFRRTIQCRAPAHEAGVLPFNVVGHFD
jgi:hypothetical protein